VAGHKRPRYRLQNVPGNVRRQRYLKRRSAENAQHDDADHPRQPLPGEVKAVSVQHHACNRAENNQRNQPGKMASRMQRLSEKPCDVIISPSHFGHNRAAKQPLRAENQDHDQ
jgi:hypothetical protein